MRGFGDTQVDLTLKGRQFKLRERLFRRERFFNILTTPNFGSPINYLSSPPLFGQSTRCWGHRREAAARVGGLNPLYQIGGPALGATGP